MEWLKHSGIAFLQVGGATTLILTFCPKEYWPAAFALVAIAMKMLGITIPSPGGIDAAIASGTPAHEVARMVVAERTATASFKPLG